MSLVGKPLARREDVGFVRGQASYLDDIQRPGTVYAAFVLRRLFTDNIADVADRICYGMVPLFAYLAGLAAAYLIFGGSTHAPEFLAGTVVLLLIVNIRNAWDLMLSMARRRGEADARGQAPQAEITPGG